MDRWNKFDEKIVIIASAIIIFSVLCFGAVELWSSAVMEVSVFTLMLIWLIRGRTGDPLSASKDEKYMIAVLFGFLAYIAIQIIPLPSLIVKYISPESFAIYSYYTTSNDPAMAISLYAYKTESELLRMFAYSLFFIIISFSMQDMTSLRRMMKILVCFGFVLALFAIIQKATWNGKIYWIRELGLGGSPFGPFVNRNHYAGLIGMLIPLSLAYAFTRRSREKKLLWGFFGIIMAVSLFLSLSRAGIISFFAGIAVFALLLPSETLRTKKRWVLAFFVCAVFSYLLYLGVDPLIDRFYKTDVTREERLTVWSSTLFAFRDFFLTGSGLGTFIYIFPSYSPENIRTIFDHAHNDYLEFILEVGLIGAVLLLVFLFFFGRFMLRSGWEGQAGIIKISLVSSIVTMAVHSIFDFNLHIPSNALMLSAVFGMAVASSRLAVRPGGQADNQLKEGE